MKISPVKQASTCCPYCNYADNYPVRRNIFEKLINSVVPIRAYICGNCHKRFVKRKFRKIKSIVTH